MKKLVYLEMRPDVKEKIRSVQKGDVLGKVYMVSDERDMLNEEVPVGVNKEENEWTKERLREAIDVNGRRKNVKGYC